MKKVLLLHGWGGSDYPHWQSWLAGEMAKNYGCVCFVRLSDFEHPKLENWLKEARGALDEFKPDVVICHSLANTLWFHLCNKGLIKNDIEHLYLVAPPSLTCRESELQEFFPLHLPRNLHAKHTTLVTSTNDPYLEEEEALGMAESLHVKHIVLNNAGHINADSGYGKWSWILEGMNTITHNQA